LWISLVKNNLGIAFKKTSKYNLLLAWMALTAGDFSTFDGRI